MNFARLSSFAAAGLMLSSLPALAKPTTVTAEVNLREEANTTSAALALVPKGGSVDVINCNNGWCKVTWDGKQGYVISRNLGIPQPRPVAGRRPPRPQVYASGPVVVDEGPIYVGPPPIYVGPPLPYYGGYYGYYRPRWGYGWHGGWGWRRW